MPTLDSGLRNALDATIGKARDEAERATGRALTTLAVNQPDPFPNLSEEERQLRNQLRAKGRQLGDRERMDARQSPSREWALVRECAYEQWHRMLFARFLAENGLLIYPEANVPVSLADCAQIAAELGIADPWTLVADYAAQMLPGIFRAEDPLLRVTLAAEGRQALERLLESIPRAVFTSEDGLGWVYQFWQSKRKEEVNASGVKIGGADIAPVTQLFTEPYMVQFLLHNSLGAWWAARHPDDPLVAELIYLRRLDDGTPAAGTFDGWPKRAAELTVLDPCCGSGHFLVAAFDLLRRMRECEEGLTPAEASLAVLRDNLHGLEIDARCTQFAAFALALAAWKAGGYQELPVPNIACSGISVGGRLYEWTNLAYGDAVLEMNLRRLYELFKNAPDLGSLIDPKDEVGQDLFTRQLKPTLHLLAAALRKEDRTSDPSAVIFGVASEGLARAAELLAKRYHFVSTNVPYLGRVKQGDILRQFCEWHYNEAKTDLATVFLERCSRFCLQGGTYAVVTPHSWLFLGAYKKMRERLLKGQSWNMVARLGSGAFEAIGGAVVNVALSIISNTYPVAQQQLTGLDVSDCGTIVDKTVNLKKASMHVMQQRGQLNNPDARVTFKDTEEGIVRLGSYARVLQGVGTTDTPRYVVRFWEVANAGETWDLYQVAPTGTEFSGYTSLLKWEAGNGDLAKIGTAHKGKQAIGKRGMAIAVTQSLNVAAFLGT